LDTSPEPGEQDVTGDRIIAGKDKTLTKVDSSNSKIFRLPLTPNNKVFAQKNEGNWASDKYHKFRGNYKNGKFPSRYVDVLERMLNTQYNNKTKRWTHFSDVPGGAGQIAAQAGELMTMIGTTMDDSEAEEFYYEVMEVSKAFKKAGGKPIVDPSWVKAAANNRKAIFNRLYDQHGNDVEVINAAWDTKEEVEALGLSNYDDNKGFKNITMKISDSSDNPGLKGYMDLFIMGTESRTSVSIDVDDDYAERLKTFSVDAINDYVKSENIDLSKTKLVISQPSKTFGKEVANALGVDESSVIDIYSNPYIPINE